MEGVGAMYFWPFCENARTAFVKCEVQGTVVRRGVELAAVAPERQDQARLQCTMHIHLRSQLEMFFLSMRESLNGLK